MRAFQVMRYGRRTSPITNKLTPSFIRSNSSTPVLKHRSSMFISGNQHRRNSIQSDCNDVFDVNR
jgi:hypothetical protein